MSNFAQPDLTEHPPRSPRVRMSYLDRSSLGATLDSVSEAQCFGKTIPEAQRQSVARWIAGRQGLPGAYAGMFAPTERDALGSRLFTGEAVHSRVGVAHLLGEEGCRILASLRVEDRAVQAALGRAVEGMSIRIDEEERRSRRVGTYCCGTCSVGYWRNLAIHLFPRAEERLRLGMKALKQHRRGDGQWRRHPFFFTSLALTEIGAELAGEEMEYAATRWRKILPRLACSEGSVGTRRATVGRRLLELCET